VATIHLAGKACCGQLPSCICTHLRCIHQVLPSLSAKLDIVKAAPSLFFSVSSQKLSCSCARRPLLLLLQLASHLALKQLPDWVVTVAVRRV
jgi:hypothetical protein